jgi:hypothetical protein
LFCFSSLPALDACPGRPTLKQLIVRIAPIKYSPGCIVTDKPALPFRAFRAFAGKSRQVLHDVFIGLSSWGLFSFGLASLLPCFAESGTGNAKRLQEEREELRLYIGDYGFFPVYSSPTR